MAFGVFLAVRLYKKGIFDRAQRVACIALFVWVAIVLLFTVLGRRSNKTDEMVYNLELFRCYHKIFMEQDRPMLISVLENILMFVPIGFTLSGVFKKHRVIIPMVLSFGLSLCIETCQLLLRSGVFELDDLFNNTLGAVIGIILCLLCSSIVKIIRKNHRKEDILAAENDR
ncbi:MAG: VanZ family protein [Ruminococcus sp.]|nr:VanZ family protein [Ruminococcus sp.]